MRVLLFSNTPSLAAKSLNKFVAGGSWIESLEYGLMARPDIDLGLVFRQLVREGREVHSEDFRTRYFMVPRYPYGKFARWVNRFFGRTPSTRPLKDYMRVVDEFKPDVVLFFGTESDFPLIIPQLKVPSIIWFQGNLTVYDRMYESGIPLRKTLFTERLKDILMGDSIYHNYLHFKRLVSREKKIFSFAENFIGRTAWDRRLVQVMSPQATYYHCDEPMRQPFLEKTWTPWTDRGKFVIVTTIRGNLYKGLETIFETSALVGGLKDLLEWRVIGIEEGSAYAKAARKKAGLASVETGVKLIGSLAATEMVEELLQADLYVHPSHIENSPNAVQEAMILGMPLIATNVGGTPSLLVDGKEGLLVQNKDPYAMAGAILELFEDPEKAKKLGEHARKRGLVRNDGDEICSQLIRIFEQMCRTKDQGE
ncbi:MAG: glycosyltransferase family 4 protein [Flavobacteriaceae bacterium]